MALPDAPSAADMVRFLRANDPRHNQLEFDEDMYGAMEGWTPRDRRSVAQAANLNTSVGVVSIDVANLTSKTTGIVSSMVAKLPDVTHVEVFDTDDYDDPAPQSVVDHVLGAIGMGPSNVRSLEMSLRSGPRAFLKLVERLPNLEVLQYDDHFDGDEEAMAFDAHRARLPFLLAVATAVSRHLMSLRHVGLQFERMHPGIPCLLTAIQGAGSNLRTVELTFLSTDDEEGEWDDALLQLAYFCACTRTAQTVVLRGEYPMEDGVLDVAPLFGVDPPPGPFSPALTEMQFHFCSFEKEEEEEEDGHPQRGGGGGLAARAVKALQNVEALRFDLCRCPFALTMVQKLPRLRRLAYLSRQYTDPEDPLDPDEAQDAHDDRFAFLATNRDVLAFCRVLAKKSSVLEDVELDLQGTEHESLPALARLLRVSRGRLVLHLGCLPRASRPHLVSGMERLRPELRELHLCFHYCRLTDEDYANILRPLQSNTTVRSLLCQWEREIGSASDQTRAAVRDLVRANGSVETLAFRGLDPYEAATLLESVLPALRSTNRSIRAVDLVGTDLSEVWRPRLQRPMLEVLQANGALSELRGFELDEDDPVHWLAKQNRYGRQFLMGGGESGGGTAGDGSSAFCPLGLWPTVLARISKDEEEGVMYAFLRSKPDLLLAGPRRGRGRGRRGRGRKRGRGEGL